MPSVKLDLIQTVAVAAVVLFLGYGVRRKVGFLDRFNIPAPVIGGLLFAALAFTLRQTETLAFEFDTTLQPPFMIAFFTTIGLGASFGLLKIGGPQVVRFWLLASLVAILQNGVGVGMAMGLRVEPLYGLLAGSVTMTGGHGTGAAFGKLFEEQYHVTGALTLALAAATFGLVGGGLLGTPVATYLVRRNRLRPSADPATPARPVDVNAAVDTEIDTEATGDAPTAYSLLKGLAVILAAMAVGGLLSKWLGQYMTLPAYIGAMLVAAIIRNADDRTRFLGLSPRVIDDLGTIALNLFLAMALMSLKLWELLDLALPMLTILTVQVILMAIFAVMITYQLMGKDYEAAVMAGGHCGFGLGATANAVANMSAIEERFGPAPRAFLVVPMVGAFFVDFSNALIITTYVNFLR